MDKYEKYIKELEEKKDMNALQDEFIIHGIVVGCISSNLLDTLSKEGKNIQEIGEADNVLLEKYKKRYQMIKEAIEKVNKEVNSIHKLKKIIDLFS